MRGGRAKNKLALNPPEAAVVRDVFERHARGLGIKMIVQQLNEEGVRTRTGGLWFKSGIAKMLTNEIYTGHKFFRPTDPITKETLPREDWIDIPCPAIVDDIMFQNTQERLHSRAPNITAPRYTTSDVFLE
jgi:site-specific DNA recombinase